LEAATASAEQQLNEIKTNLATIQQKIADACAKAGREPSSVRLLPVTKTVPAERLRIAFAAGCEEMGENKVQEAREKSELLSDLAIKWCIIGHLQTNKVKYITRFAHEFQALDSLKVAAELDKRLQAAGRGMDVYVQVNSSGEASKFGLPPEEVEDFVRQLPDYASLRVKGLMTLAIFSTDHERVRACFVRMRELQERLRQSAPAGLSFDELSMVHGHVRRFRTGDRGGRNRRARGTGDIRQTAFTRQPLLAGVWLVLS